jgi:hypothetical protein
MNKIPSSPFATPAVSVMLEEVQLGIEPTAGPDGIPTYPVVGRGVLAPGMVIPNAWWGRERLVRGVEVSEPDKARADGMLGLRFWGWCRAQDFAKLNALIEGGVRELVECEVVPAIIEALGAAGELAAKLGRAPVAVGTAVDWGPGPASRAFRANTYGQILKKYAQDRAETFAPPSQFVEAVLAEAQQQADAVAAYVFGGGATIAPPERRPSHMVIHDLIRLAAGQDVPGGRDAVLREAEDQGMLGSADFQVLVEAARAAGASPPPAESGRPARVRVVDT